MDEFAERMDYADLDDEDLVESMEQIKALVASSHKGGDSGLADALQGTIDRMAREIAGREERYGAIQAAEEPKE